MNESNLNRMIREHKARIIWFLVFLILAVFVTALVFGTLKRSVQAQTYTKRVFACSYAQEGAEPVAHQHNDDCYENGELICTLPERELHIHGDECYTEEKVLVCTLEESEGHVHTDACYTEEPVLVCGLEENNGHVHSVENGCYTRVQGDLICTDEDPEHVHTDECYAWEEVLTCEIPEGEGAHHHSEECYETQRVLSCGKEEGEGAHTHDDTCYEIQKVLICDKEEVKTEHVHTVDCFKVVDMSPEEIHALRLSELPESDPTADVESPDVWESRFASVPLSGEWDRDLLKIAETQLGYTESQRNFDAVLNEDGEGYTLKGWTRYGAWYGIPYGDWCAMFISFCLNYADIPESAIPYDCATTTWIDSLSERGMYAPAGSYDPKPGDLIFFDWEGDGLSDHVGIVWAVNPGSITTIEGNHTISVELFDYDLSDGHIQGYGVLPSNPAIASADSKTDVDLADYPAQSFEKEVGNIIVSVKADAGAFPDGTTMEVEAVEDDTLAEQVAPAVNGKVVNIQAVDITFYDSDGNEIEPLIPIRVTMQPKDIEATTTEADNVEVVHVDDNGGVSAVEVDAADDADQPDQGASFDADAFSKYVLVYTVSFEYEVNGEVYSSSVEGGQSVALSDLLRQFEVCSDKEMTEFMSKIVKVSVPDPEIIQIEAIEGDWSICPLKYTEDPQTLTIAMQDGASFSIQVRAYGNTQVSDENTVISSVDNLFLPTEASASSEILNEELNEKTVQDAIEAVELAAKPTEENTAYQVVSISLDGVDYSDYKNGFQVSLTLPESVACKDFEVYHIDENGEAQILDLVETDARHLEEETALISTVSFVTPSFSDFVIRYTIDFHYKVNGQRYEFSFAGGSFVSLEQLLELLQITDKSTEADEPEEPDEAGQTEKRVVYTDLADIEVSEETKSFVADIKDVTFTNPDLLWVGKTEEETTVGALKEAKDLVCQYSAELTEEQIAAIDAQKVTAGDWALISLESFESEESLTIIMNDGDVFTIRVTDETTQYKLKLKIIQSDELGIDLSGDYYARVEIRTPNPHWPEGTISYFALADLSSISSNQPETKVYDLNFRVGDGGKIWCSEGNATPAFLTSEVFRNTITDIYYCIIDVSNNKNSISEWVKNNGTNIITYSENDSLMHYTLHVGSQETEDLYGGNVCVTDTMILQEDAGTIQKSDIDRALAQAREFGLYTEELSERLADMEANIGAASVTYTNDLEQMYGFTSNNIEVNRITVTKRYVDQDGKAIEQPVTIGLFKDSNKVAEKTDTTKNGTVVFAFSGLTPGEYIIKEKLQGMEDWQDTSDTINVNGQPITVTFEDPSIVIPANANTNINYFQSITNIDDKEYLKKLITASRNGIIVTDGDSNYKALKDANNEVDVSNRATIYKNGSTEFGRTFESISTDMAKLRQLSAQLGDAISSETTRIINITLEEFNGFGSGYNIKGDGRYVILNIDCTNEEDPVSFNCFVKYDDERLVADFGKGGWEASSKVLFNFITRDADGAHPYNGTVEAKDTCAGVLFAPDAVAGKVPGNWGGTVICREAKHSDGEIHSDNPNKIYNVNTVVTNTRGKAETGNLRLVKEIEGAQDFSTSFTLEVSFDDNDVKNKEFDALGVIGNKIKFDASGKALIQVKVNKPVTIYGLPNGSSFTVAEKETNESKNYQLVKIVDGDGHQTEDGKSLTGTIKQGTTVIAKAINQKTTGGPGALSITKTVLIDGVVPTEANQMLTDGVYVFAINGKTGTDTASISREIKITFRNGKAVQTQVDDDSPNVVEGTNNSWKVIIGDLLPGEYTVQETSGGNMTLSGVTVGGNSVENGATVTVTAGDTTALQPNANIVFTNDINTVSVWKVWKNLAGSYDTWPDNQSINFALKQIKRNQVTDLASFEIKTIGDGNPPQVIPTWKSGTTYQYAFTVETKQINEKNTQCYKLSIIGLPESDDQQIPYEYRIIEDETVEGFNPYYYYYDGNLHSLEDQRYAADGQFIVNNPAGGYELPKTGGPGTALYTLLGGLIFAMAGAVLTLRKKKNKA